MNGNGAAPINGLGTVTYPIALPTDAVPVIMVSDMISTDPGDTHAIHQSIVIARSRTVSGFSVRQRSTGTTTPANGFAWEVIYAPV